VRANSFSESLLHCWCSVWVGWL